MTGQHPEGDTLPPHWERPSGTALSDAEGFAENAKKVFMQVKMVYSWGPAGDFVFL